MVSSSVGDRQTCKCCGHPHKFNFNVPDGIWAAIVPIELRGLVVCLECFDDFAREKGIDYSEAIDLLYFAGDQVSFAFKREWGIPT